MLILPEEHTGEAWNLAGSGYLSDIVERLVE
jgi:hypothetical protein